MTVLIGMNLAGCGGGGGGDDDDDSPSGSNFAPEAIAGNNVTFFAGNEGTRTITFNDASAWAETRDDTEASGTYSYGRMGDAGTAELLLNEEGAETRIILTFNSASSGSFVNMTEDRQGTFEINPINPNPDPGGGNEPPANDGLAPSTLADRTMYGTRTFTSTGPVGQTHVYTFSLNTFHDSDPPEESDGVYLYEPNGDEAQLTLDYRSPAFFDGDKHEMRMTFHTENAGVFESLYTRRDGTVIRINGTFTID